MCKLLWSPFYSCLVFWRQPCHWKLRLLCLTAYTGELQAEPYLAAMLLNRWIPVLHMILECNKIVWFWEAVFPPMSLSKWPKGLILKSILPRVILVHASGRRQLWRNWKKVQKHHPCIEIFSFPELKRVQKWTCFGRKHRWRTYVHC